MQPEIIPRAEHAVSRADISEYALKVLYRLKKAGYAAYLVGGGVRDLLLRHRPKDFDVATDATPDEVKKLFRNCRLIGRRFRLAHVHFGRDIIEVATFRAQHRDGDEDGVMTDGMILRDNVFGSLEEDAFRRDFTVNALYYNIEDFSLVDYTGGLSDLEQRRLRMIGDPEVRIQEDPVRLLRALRFAAKLGFSLDPQLEQQFARHGGRLLDVPPARLFEEILKLFMSGYGIRAFELLVHYDIFRYLFPQTADLMEADDGYTRRFIEAGLGNTDRRLQDDKPVTPFFLFGVLLWPVVRQQAQLLQEQDESELQALQQAAGDVVQAQTRRITIPKRFGLPMKETWLMQARLSRRQGKRAVRLLEAPRFRAGYDFLLLRQQAGEPLQELCDWWTQFQEADEKGQRDMLQTVSPGKSKRGRRRRKKHT
ncbi:polynucleotide adenylyltransferase PcnB [Thiohalophilus sp.]|uniref:polynucleotide adenylyltransferase PcnB n=1 Tax=Thiohalophilus sp. TaxID=3028392 RepID=UPI002ACDA21C|nr:polynucleotide adenylyltransferase PcnB [Thiohalophilus sp.]MDZ7802801.1 polynucleotide adenylyltransferase PcnB [Thiohalophilus sp.]